MIKAIGERQLKLGDRTFVLRPSFQAYMTIEEATGRDLLTLFADFRQGKGGIKVVRDILHSMILASDENENPPSIEEFGEMIVGSLNDATPMALEVLVAGLAGGSDQKKAPAAANKKKSTGRSSSKLPSGDSSKSGPETSTE